MAGDTKLFKEELKRRIYTFVLSLLKFVDEFSNADAITRVIRDQLIRSGTSIGANYVEAIAGSSKKDFTNFLSYALKSANESKFWLALIRDTNKGDRGRVEQLLKELNELSSILATSVRTLRNK